jgi:L-ascorbate metabolism protein UlaG (beta-lactamase superfamily)
VELEKQILVFDYFRGDRMGGYHFSGVLPEFDLSKELYFFASHMHQDHFDIDILKLADQYPKIHYVLAKDIRLGDAYLLRHGIPFAIRERITFVRPNEDYTISDIAVHTLRSTDAGVAFLVKAEHKSIYHAGDLHNWKFEGDNETYHKKMESDYMLALKPLLNLQIDVAFVVLDPRLGPYISLGMDYFIQHIHADVIFPMHMWQNYQVIEDYKKAGNRGSASTQIMDVTRENQVFEL